MQAAMQAGKALTRRAQAAQAKADKEAAEKKSQVGDGAALGVGGDCSGPAAQPRRMHACFLTGAALVKHACLARCGTASWHQAANVIITGTWPVPMVVPLHASVCAG